jgi:penicillin-binding protein 1A
VAARGNGRSRNGNGPPNGNGRPNGNRRRKNGNGKHGAAFYANHRRRDRSRRRRERANRRRLFALSTLLVVVGLLAALAAAAFTGATAFRNSCDLNSLRPVTIGQNSFVYAADGSLLGAIPAEKNRQPLEFDRMSPWVLKATVAIEDRRFWEHGGLDYEGIIRAAVKNLEEGKIVEGGSTITQQLVRNLYIGNEQSFERKIKEACLALKLNESWTKEEILETYMNQVPYGNHAYGIESAAQTYFARSAGKLNLVQSALLAGLPQAPSAYDPFARPEAARERRNEVLAAMLEGGDIDQAQYDRAVKAPLRLRRGELYTKIREPYFFGYVRDLLIKKYGVTRVRSGGLEVHTTIDPRFQRLAKKAIKANLYLETDPASALVSINPKNGAIRAMAAVAPGRKGLQFNLAEQGRRQAGSAFKTFVLTEAMKQGINPDSTRYMSAPFTWQPDPLSEPWEVSTFDHSYYGVSTVRQATIRSDNTVFARLTLDVGPEKVAQTAREMGIKTKLESVASIGLGSNAVSVLEMASAYATLAAGGIYSEPMAIRKVVLPSGNVDLDAGWGEGKRKRVMTDGQAYAVTQILQENILGGTGTAANPGRPAAGKTGTTDDFADAWFCGYTPNLATAVWVGYPNAQIEMRSVHGISVAGGTFPAMIWHDFVVPALAGSPGLTFPTPTEPAVWLPFHGQWAFYGPPPGQSDGGGGDKDEEKEDKNSTTTGSESEPPTTTEPPATTEPSATTEPPPTTTQSSN